MGWVAYLLKSGCACCWPKVSLLWGPLVVGSQRASPPLVGVTGVLCSGWIMRSCVSVRYEHGLCNLCAIGDLRALLPIHHPSLSLARLTPHCPSRRLQTGQTETFECSLLKVLSCSVTSVVGVFMCVDVVAVVLSQRPQQPFVILRARIVSLKHMLLGQ